MNETKAREIFSRYDIEVVDDSKGLTWSGIPVVSWWPEMDKSSVRLDGDFMPDLLEAIAWWMRQFGEKTEPPK